MKTINMTVNGKVISGAAVEPRTQLADFVRDNLNLTGTHLGCEHGVCGACTLMIDGVPARSCITLAVACDGANVTTIEGMDDDEVMRALRAAFQREHALQCGYCTPGMLASAHDVVLRMPDANEADVRFAMSGNLCRCTGYVGITKAVLSVIEERRAAGVTEPVARRNDLGPVGSGHAGAMAAEVIAKASSTASAVTKAAPAKPAAARTPPAVDSSKPMTTIEQTFTVEFPREQVWKFFGKLDEVTLCLPGASLLAPPTETHVEPKLRIKVGPIVADFEGTADVERDPANYVGTIFGSARDTKSASATRGEIRYTLVETTTDEGAAATRVDVQVGFALTGPLAQFSRSSIVLDIAKRMTDAFASNLRARLSHPAGGNGAPPMPAAELNAGALVFSVIRDRIVGFFRKLFGGK
jgi:carbon-monoxide dehydrogenase small subunit